MRAGFCYISRYIYRGRGVTGAHRGRIAEMGVRFPSSPFFLDRVGAVYSSQRCGSGFVGVSGEDLAEIYAMVVALRIIFAFGGVGEHLGENVGRA